MGSNKEILLDIIYMKKVNNELYIQELNDSLKDMDEEKNILYKHDIKLKKEELEFLDELKEEISITSNGLGFLNKLLKTYNDSDKPHLITISKYDIINQILKEYKIEYKKNYWNNKKVGTNGVFDNTLFCKIIRRKIDKYTNCNKVTRKKYNHLVVFLNEFLHEMEHSNDPLKTLKQKMRLYSRYKKTEIIEIRDEQISKISLVKEILNEYNNKKITMR